MIGELLMCALFCLHSQSSIYIYIWLQLNNTNQLIYERAKIYRVLVIRGTSSRSGLGLGDHTLTAASHIDQARHQEHK